MLGFERFFARSDLGRHGLSLLVSETDPLLPACRVQPCRHKSSFVFLEGVTPRLEGRGPRLMSRNGALGGHCRRLNKWSGWRENAGGTTRRGVVIRKTGNFVANLLKTPTQVVHPRTACGVHNRICPASMLSENRMACGEEGVKSLRSDGKE
jgi:hypothetical protein